MNRTSHEDVRYWLFEAPVTARHGIVTLDLPRYREPFRYRAVRFLRAIAPRALWRKLWIRIEVARWHRLHQAYRREYLRTLPIPEVREIADGFYSRADWQLYEDFRQEVIAAHRSTK